MEDDHRAARRRRIGSPHGLCPDPEVMIGRCLTCSSARPEHLRRGRGTSRDSASRRGRYGILGCVMRKTLPLGPPVGKGPATDYPLRSTGWDALLDLEPRDPALREDYAPPPVDLLEMATFPVRFALVYLVVHWPPGSAPRLRSLAITEPASMPASVSLLLLALFAYLGWAVPPPQPPGGGAPAAGAKNHSQHINHRTLTGRECPNESISPLPAVVLAVSVVVIPLRRADVGCSVANHPPSRCYHFSPAAPLINSVDACRCR